MSKNNKMESDESRGRFNIFAPLPAARVWTPQPPQANALPSELSSLVFIVLSLELSRMSHAQNTPSNQS